MREGQDGVRLAGIAKDRLLPGEDLQAVDREDDLHWVSVYEELFRFTAELIAQTRASLSRLPAEVQQRGKTRDLPMLLQASERLEQRLQFWKQRLETSGKDRTG